MCQLSNDLKRFLLKMRQAMILTEVCVTILFLKSYSLMGDNQSFDLPILTNSMRSSLVKLYGLGRTKMNGGTLITSEVHD